MDRPGMNELSPRERDAAGLLAAGLTDAEIGQRLGPAAAGVVTIVEQFVEWLDVQDRAEGAAWARGIGLQHGGGCVRDCPAESVTTPAAAPESLALPTMPTRAPGSSLDAPAPWWQSWVAWLLTRPG
jgi:DNA-binding CsgD family transcriptional regulator